MKIRTLSLILALAMSASGPAFGQTYVKADAWVANISKVNGDNLCGAIGIGHELGWFRLEAEASCHNHLGLKKFALTGMAYAQPWTFGRVTPYAGIGFGATRDEPVFQGALGIAIEITGNSALTVGIVHRCYDSHCDSRDDAGIIGLKVQR